jgi:CRP/FNR family transcriptional regulator, cyclic AMP receptor protein
MATRTILARPTPGGRGAAGDRSWANVLATVPLFSALSRRHLGKLAKAGRIVRFDGQTTIVRAGEPGDTLYVVLDGEVTVAKPRGRAARVGVGGFFGEMSLLDGGPRSATVTANTDVHALVLPPREFWQVLDEVPAIAHKLLSTIAARLRATDEIAFHTK